MMIARASLACVAAALLHASPLHAGVVTFGFSGNISRIDGSGAGLSFGEGYSGSFSYDESAPLDHIVEPATRALYVTDALCSKAEAQTIMHGNAVNELAIGINEIPVGANQGGIEDSTLTLSTGSWELFDPTSSVPEVPVESQIKNTSWGRLKVLYKDAPTLKRTALNKALTQLPMNSLSFNGGTAYFNIDHFFGDINGQGEYVFNIFMIPRNYGGPNFGPVPMNIEDVKAFYRIPLQSDNYFWRVSREGTYPMPIQLTGTVTQAKIDSLNSRMAKFNIELQRPGRGAIYAQGTAVYGQYGIYWITNSTENTTTYDLFPGTLEIRSIKIRTTNSGYLDYSTSMHELARALGISGTEDRIGYGMLNTPSSSPVDADWAVLDIGISKEELTESDQNQSIFTEYH